MRHATENDLKEIYAIFQQHRDVFPHVRQDTLKRRIEAHQCINQDGVIITYQQYKKRTKVGGVQVPAGAIMVHQILNTNQFNGAGGRVFEQFVEEMVKPSGGDLYLSVRKENTVACQFYERHGMSVVGTVSWSAGTIPGLVYRLSPKRDHTRAKPFQNWSNENGVSHLGRPDVRRTKRSTEEQPANACEEVTDGCCRLLRVTRDNARQWQRVKPDPEVHFLA